LATKITILNDQFTKLLKLLVTFFLQVTYCQCNLVLDGCCFISVHVIQIRFTNVYERVRDKIFYNASECEYNT